MKKLLFIVVLVAGGVLVTSSLVTITRASARPAAPRSKCEGYYALTFDDGPTSTTPKLLAMLKSLGVHATFFVTGQHAYENPKFIAAIRAGGHEIGDHTWNHVDLTTLVGTPKLDGEDGEIGGTANYLERALNVPKIKWFRPPYGSTNDAVRVAATKFGMAEVLWTVDTSDWDKRPTEQIVAKALTVQPGGIVLMHDSPYTNTIAALPAIVDGLRAKGLCAGRIVPSATPISAWRDVTFGASAAAW